MRLTNVIKMGGPINRIAKLFSVHTCMYRYPLNKLICKKMMKTQDDDDEKNADFL